jgi:hypothetical protein
MSGIEGAMQGMVTALMWFAGIVISVVVVYFFVRAQGARKGE